MTAFLLVTASAAVVIGLVGLVARYVPRTTGRQRSSRAFMGSWSRGRGPRRSSPNRRGHARGKEATLRKILEPQTGPLDDSGLS